MTQPIEILFVCMGSNVCQFPRAREGVVAGDLISIELSNLNSFVSSTSAFSSPGPRGTK